MCQVMLRADQQRALPLRDGPQYNDMRSPFFYRTIAHDFQDLSNLSMRDGEEWMQPKKRTTVTLL